MHFSLEYFKGFYLGLCALTIFCLLVLFEVSKLSFQKFPHEFCQNGNGFKSEQNLVGKVLIHKNSVIGFALLCQ